MSKFFRTALAAAALLAAAGGAQAADLTLSGTISNHNDVVELNFTIGSSGASNVRIWSDSWQSGLNFDPIAALWQKTDAGTPVGGRAGYTLLSKVDDDDTVGAGQGFYDTGFALPSLAAGLYRVTLGAAPNTAVGAQLTQGFAFDGQAPILLSAWNQPSYDPNANDQKGGFWQLNFSNVESVTAVPEPSMLVLFGLGLAGLVARRRQFG